jgi:hypothetical protein
MTAGNRIPLRGLEESLDGPPVQLDDSIEISPHGRRGVGCERGLDETVQLSCDQLGPHHTILALQSLDQVVDEQPARRRAETLSEPLSSKSDRALASMSS